MCIRAPASVRPFGGRRLRRHAQERRVCRSRRQRLGRRPDGGNDSQPFFQRFGRTTRFCSWGPLTKSHYHCAPGRASTVRSRTACAEGGLHAVAREERDRTTTGGAGLTWNAPSQLEPQLCAGRLRPDRTSFRWRSSTSCHTSRTAPAIARPPRLRRLAGQRPVQRIFGHAVHDHRERCGARTCRATSRRQRQSERRLQDHRRSRRRRVLLRPVGVQPATGRDLRQHGTQRVPRPGRLEPRLLAVPGLPDRRRRQAAEFRAEFFNLLNHPIWGIPCTTSQLHSADVNSSTFGNVGVGTSSRDAGTGERQIRLGVRFQF